MREKFCSLAGAATSDFLSRAAPRRRVGSQAIALGFVSASPPGWTGGQRFIAKSSRIFEVSGRVCCPRQLRCKGSGRYTRRAWGRHVGGTEHEGNARQPRDRREQRHRRVRRLPLFPELRGALAVAREGAEDGVGSRLPARRPVLRRGGRRHAPRPRRLVLRGTATGDAARGRTLRLLEGRQGRLKASRRDLGKASAAEGAAAMSDGGRGRRPARAAEGRTGQGLARPRPPNALLEGEGVQDQAKREYCAQNQA